MSGPFGKTYIAIDLKSFYASVECAARGLDPLTTNLVVADESRTEKTICLAVTPSLKSYGVSGRARLFEVVERVRQINADRRAKAPGRKFSAKSFSDPELKADPSLELDFIIAKPRMAEYMRVSTEIFNIYMRYVSAEDMHVYSVDEVFIDATSYLKLYGLTAEQFAAKLIGDVLSETGITATVGIGTNMYLCKIAMDIVAKRMPPDENGVRIAALDEQSYRELLWDHRPITDFWRIGGGYARRLASAGMYTMGDVARCSVHNEDLLYRMFGVNAELLIDHAWGWEPCTIADIKKYRPAERSLSCGQVLSRPYKFDEARLIVREMTDGLSLDLVRKGVLTDQIVLTVCYDTENITRRTDSAFKGQVMKDRYGRTAPKDAHGSINIPGGFTSSGKAMLDAVTELFDSIVDKDLLVRRMYVVANHVRTERRVEKESAEQQLDIFSLLADKGQEEKKQQDDRGERARQEAVLKIRGKFGKNAIVRGMDLQEAATAMERNAQVGGHKA
ncbi:MAG: DNA methylase [Firmicutes bacterium]|nr:DNA methylase [Bacillota bacterium]